MSAAPPPIDPAGAAAVVTGGASGIGRAIATSLLRRGASVVIADVEAPALEATVAELSGAGPAGSSGAVSGVVTDVSDESSVAELADAVWERHGRCDLLFLNAGVTSGGGGLPRSIAATIEHPGTWGAHAATRWPMRPAAPWRTMRSTPAGPDSPPARTFCDPAAFDSAVRCMCAL